MAAEERTHGGAREGAGAPVKDRLVKKVQIGLALPPWLVEKIDGLEGKEPCG